MISGVINNLWSVQRGAVKRMKMPINGLVFYAPLWHPELAGSPFLSKDLDAHTCTVTGATWGIQGRTFDGNDDYIKVLKANITQIDFTTENFTFILWINQTNQTAAQYLFNKIDNAVNTAGYYARINTDGAIRIETIAAGGNDATITTAADIPTGAWTMVTVVKSGTDVLLYKDNATALVETVSGVHDTILSAAAYDFYIGIFPILAGDYIGTMGEVLIYNRALSALEISHTYNNSRWRYL